MSDFFIFKYKIVYIMSLELKLIIRNKLFKHNKLVTKFLIFDFQKLSQNELIAK